MSLRHNALYFLPYLHIDYSQKLDELYSLVCFAADLSISANVNTLNVTHSCLLNIIFVHHSAVEKSADISPRIPQHSDQIL